MGSEWTLKKIGEFAEVKGGKRLPKGNRLSEKKTIHPYIRVVDFTDGRISLSNLLYVPEEVFPNIKRYIVESGDVVISIVGTIGLVATIPSKLHEANLTENAAKILMEDNTVDSQYLSYYLKSSIGQHEIQRNTVGSTQPKLPLYGIKNIEVSYPPLPEQRAIAHILGSLDDKIELNRRMNQTLEAMARAIFKSWFVDFDPVRAKAEGRPTGLPDDIAALFPDSFEDSELGKIPTGWEVKTISEVAEFAYGKALKASDRKPGDIPVFGSNGQVGLHNEALAKGPGIVIGRKGNPGIVTWSYEDFFPIDTTFYVKRTGIVASLNYLFYALKAQDLPSLSADSVVPGLNRNLAYMSKFLVPHEDVLTAFDGQVDPLFQKIYENEKEAKTLASLRDTLLPKLISGELRVPDAEKFVEEASL